MTFLMSFELQCAQKYTYQPSAKVCKLKNKIFTILTIIFSHYYWMSGEFRNISSCIKPKKQTSWKQLIKFTRRLASQVVNWNDNISNFYWNSPSQKSVTPLMVLAIQKTVYFLSFEVGHTRVNSFVQLFTLSLSAPHFQPPGKCYL